MNKDSEHYPSIRNRRGSYTASDESNYGEGTGVEVLGVEVLGVEVKEGENVASEGLNQWIDRMHDDASTGQKTHHEESSRESEDRMASLAMQLWQIGSQAAATIVEPSKSPKIDGYQIHRVIGRGGMGVVYSATEECLNRDVALNVLPTNIGSSVKARRRFQVEVQAAAQLVHPSIVPIYRYGEYDGGLFYTMREIDGVDLSVKLREKQTTEFGPVVAIRARDYRRWVATIGIQVADALAHSHEQMVVHRDVKPANILIERKGNAYLSDFGLARLSEGSSLTGEQDLLGTVRKSASANR